jgi:hypothetical protein
MPGGARPATKWRACRLCAAWWGPGSSPAARFRELGAALSRPQTDATTLRQAVIDYAYLHRQLPPAEPLGEWLTGLIDARDPASRSCGGRAVSTGMSDPTPAETRCLRAQLSQRAFTRYQKSPGKRAWLFTAAAFAERSDPHREALLQALADVPDGHPGSTTFLLHRLRLSGRDNGRHLAEVLLARPEVVADYSARNRVRQYRMLSAASLEEFWSDAVRERGGGIDRDTLLKGPSVVANATLAWDADASWILDYELPDSALLATATHSAWPETLRRQVAGMIWARAVLRGDTRSARDILVLPELQGGLPAEEAARLASIGDDAVFLMESRLTLWNPALTPVVGGDWCLLRPPVVADRQEDGWGDRDDPAHRFGEAALRLLPVDALERWREERQVLDALPPRTNLLMQNTLDFVARFPSDPRAPRLLRETVHAARLDHCGDAAAGALSKKAFNLLKRHYGETEEARRTRHWFKPGILSEPEEGVGPTSEKRSRSPGTGSGTNPRAGGDETVHATAGRGRRRQTVFRDGGLRLPAAKARHPSRAASLHARTLDASSSAGIFAGRFNLTAFGADVRLPARRLLPGSTPIDAFSEQP